VLGWNCQETTAQQHRPHGSYLTASETMELILTLKRQDRFGLAIDAAEPPVPDSGEPGQSQRNRRIRGGRFSGSWPGLAARSNTSRRRARAPRPPAGARTRP
jgi:hypothetical protein